MQSKISVGIIAAMKIELDGLKKCMTDTVTENISGINFVQGNLYGKRIVAAVCGIGKVFASLCAQTMILRYNPNVIINTGVAGTLTSELSIGDIAVSEDVVQHDMDTTALGDEAGLISGLDIVHIPSDKAATDLMQKCVSRLGTKCVRGTIASGDVFLNDSERKNKIADTFKAIACEMEGAGIGQVCYVNKVPFTVLRAISDGGDDNSHMDYPTFAKLAAEKSIEAVKLFVSEF